MALLGRMDSTNTSQPAIVQEISANQIYFEDVQAQNSDNEDLRWKMFPVFLLCLRVIVCWQSSINYKLHNEHEGGESQFDGLFLSTLRDILINGQLHDHLLCWESYGNYFVFQYHQPKLDIQSLKRYYFLFNFIFFYLTYSCVSQFTFPYFESIVLRF